MQTYVCQHKLLQICVYYNKLLEICVYFSNQTDMMSFYPVPSHTHFQQLVSHTYLQQLVFHIFAATCVNTHIQYCLNIFTYVELNESNLIATDSDDGVKLLRGFAVEGIMVMGLLGLGWSFTSIVKYIQKQICSCRWK